MARRSDRLVLAIGAFKLFKATILVALGIVGLLAINEEVATTAERAVGWTGIYSGRETIERALDNLWSLDDAEARLLGVLSLCYAVVFVVEGIGLLMRRRWAEWLTVFVTASFIPMELYELAQQTSPTRVLALVLNVAIVLYLAGRRLEDRTAGQRLIKKFHRVQRAIH